MNRVPINQRHMAVDVVLFDGFEPLDVFGPVEVLGRLGSVQGSPVSTTLRFVSLDGARAHGALGVAMDTERMDASDAPDVMLVPGGMGTRSLVGDGRFLSALASLAQRSAYCLTVCTGSAVLAATGLLDERRATSNKRAFAWVRGVRPQVMWVDSARWVVDGRYVTSSGVSAGIDMALGFVAERFGGGLAERTAHDIEYVWNEHADDDPFALAAEPDRSC